MKVIQILLFGTLSFAANIKCQSFPPSKTINYLPADIEVDEKDDARIADGNRVDAYAVYNITSKRVRRAGSFGSPPGGCKSVVVGPNKICSRSTCTKLYQDCCAKPCKGFNRCGLPCSHPDMAGHPDCTHGCSSCTCTNVRCDQC